ncbi:hypothetical protein F9802_12935 [Bacillus aerolatus]|uniref:Uncharacterized protein n=1 Tax=Bacillus aerolatus TaxID=2653354 RepID=A0A6I1FJ58_9BACI|nr:hypothetical protein [Bacillus aerolatus]KAB7705964.1 hypothetical protein F9802_12935 [Bacillus aerolatus]
MKNDIAGLVFISVFLFLLAGCNQLTRVDVQEVLPDGSYGEDRMIVDEEEVNSLGSIFEQTLFIISIQ